MPNLVQSSVEDIEGISNAKVDLAANTLSFDSELADSELLGKINAEIEADNFTASL